MTQNGYGGQDMFSPLRKVLVKRPDRHFGEADPSRWHYSGGIDLEIAQVEHDAFTDLLRAAGAEVFYHDEEQPGRADAIFVFDPVLVTDRGAVLLSMGKPGRRGEEEAIGRRLEALGVPVVAKIRRTGRVEGGDLLWLDSHTLAAGIGFRTDLEGMLQLRQILAPMGISVLPVELPYHAGPAACLHLLSLISIVDERLAVVHRPLLSVRFHEELLARGFRLVDVPPEELATLGPNVLATAPGRCIMLEGNPRTRERLEAVGCQVEAYRGEQLSLKAEGGPTCLTRPILRAG